MRKNRICARLIAALLLAVLPVFLFAGCGSKDPVLATYKDAEITRSLVDYQKQTMRHLNGAAEVSDKEAVDELLINNIMLDEAETRGLSVSQEEIDAMLQSQHDNYENYEEIRAIIDDYCKEQDLTTEQYFAVLEEQVPRSILRQKLRDALGQEYGIMVRVGLHCAPNAHKTLGTFPTGTIRFSFGHQNTTRQVDAALLALRKLCGRTTWN